jgi:hypothetical protein
MTATEAYAALLGELPSKDKNNPSQDIRRIERLAKAGERLIDPQTPPKPRG